MTVGVKKGIVKNKTNRCLFLPQTGQNSWGKKSHSNCGKYKKSEEKSMHAQYTPVNGEHISYN